jgi:integrase
MASIHKRPNSPFYYAAWRTKTGRLILRSTKQTDRTRALEVAMAAERAEKLAAKDMLTEVQVRKILGDVLERCGNGETLRQHTIADYFETWLKSKRVGEGSAKTYRFAVQSLLESLGDRANRPLEALSVEDIKTWIARDGTSQATVTLYGGIIRSALKEARLEGLIIRNPAEVVKLPKKGKGGVKRGVFTPTEIKILIDAAEDEWKTMILFGYYTGARLSDCATMRWADLDMANGMLVHQQGKTGHEVSIPLHPELRARLEAVATGDQAQEYVLPGLASEVIAGRNGGRNGLSDTFIQIALKAGLDLRPVTGAGGRQQYKRTFHALRHSFTSALANAGVSPELRQKLTGHTSADVHRGYTHFELQTLREAVEKLPKLLK